MSVHNMMRPARWRTYPDRALADVDEYRLQVVLKAFRGMGATDDQIEEDERRFRIDAQYYNEWVERMEDWYPLQGHERCKLREQGEIGGRLEG